MVESWSAVQNNNGRAFTNDFVEELCAVDLCEAFFDMKGSSVLNSEGKRNENGE